MIVVTYLLRQSITLYKNLGGLEQNLGGLEPLSPIASAATAYMCEYFDCYLNVLKLSEYNSSKKCIVSQLKHIVQYYYNGSFHFLYQSFAETIAES